MRFFPAAAAAAVAAAFAAGPAAADEQALEPLVVTATQTATKASSAPAEVTVITSEDLSDRNAERFTDAMTLVPGLYLNSDGNGQSNVMTGAGNFTLRGMNSSRTLVLLDGIPLNDGGFNNVDFRTLLTDDVDRIEVVPGAFSSLYGSNAIGGVINVLTKQPDQREDTVRVKKSWEDADGEEIDLYFRNKYGRLGIGLGYGYQTTKGYASNLVEAGPLAPGTGTPVTGVIPTNSNSGTPTYIVGDQGAMPWHQINGVVHLSYDLTSEDRLFASVNLNQLRISYTPYDVYVRDSSGNLVNDAAGPLVANGQQFYMPGDAGFETVAPSGQGDLRVTAGYEGVIGRDDRFKIELSRSSKSYYYSSIDFNALVASFGNSSIAVGTWAGGPGVLTSNPNETTDVLAQITVPLHAQTIVAGVDLHNTSLVMTVYNVTDWRDPSTKTTPQSGAGGNSDSIAAFAQDEIRLDDQWKAYVGARVDRWRTEGSNYQIATAANSDVGYSNDFAQRGTTAFSPKLSVVWEPGQQVTLRASAGRSFRAPDSYELYGTSYCCGSFYYANPALDPETATSLELGGDWRPARGVKLTLAAYQTTINNMIFNKTTSYNAATGASTLLEENAGMARVRGLEFAAGARLASWADFNLSASHVISGFLENAAEPATVGNRLPGTPENMVAASLRLHTGPWNGLVETKYTGKSYGSELNAETASGVFGTWDNVTVTNAKLAYQFDKWVRASVAVNNLGNVTYYEYYLMPGRNYTAELDFSF